MLSVAIEYSVDNGTTWKTYCSFAGTTPGIVEQEDVELRAENYSYIVPKLG